MQNIIRYIAAKTGPTIGYLSRALVLIAILLISVSSGVDVSSIQAKSSEAELVEVPSAPLYHPAFEKSANAETSLYLYNEDTQTVFFIITFYDQTGIEAGVYSGSIGVNSFTVLNNESLAASVNDGFYSVVVSSDGDLSSVVRTFNQETKTLSLYRGASYDETSNTLMFGPFFKTAARDSSIYLQRVGLSAASVTAQAITENGAVAQTISKTINGFSGLTISVSDFDLPDEFTGWVQVTSDQQLAGLLAPTSGQDQIGLYPPVAFYEPLQIAAASTNNATYSPAYLPRVYSNTLHGNSLRNTKIFVGNLSSWASSVTGTGYVSNSPQTYRGTVNSIPASGFIFSSLDDLLSLDDAFSGSVVTSNDADVAVAELTESDGGYAMASYGSGLSFTDLSVAQRRAGAAQVVPMPYIGHGADHYSILSIQNTGSSVATISVTFINPDGSIRLQQTLAADTNRSIAIDTREQTDLAAGFAGSVVVISDQRVAAYVDEYVEISDSTVATPTPSQTETATPTATATLTPTATLIPTATPIPTQTPTPVPTVFVPQTAILPPSFWVINESGSSFVDTTTGAVTVEVPQADRPQLTIQRVAVCADGSSPTSVDMVAEWSNETKRYAMRAVIFGLYEGVIPTTEITGDANLRVEVTCNAQVTSAAVGRIQYTESTGSSIYLPNIHR